MGNGSGQSAPAAPKNPPELSFGEESGACRGGRNRSLLSSLDLSSASSYQPFFLPRPAFNASGSPCPRHACCQPPWPLLPGSAGPELPLTPSVLPPHPGPAGSGRDRRAKPRSDGKAGAQEAQPWPSHDSSPSPGPRGEADKRLCVPVTLLTRIPRLGCIHAGSRPRWDPGRWRHQICCVLLLEVCNPEPCLVAPIPPPLSIPTAGAQDQPLHERAPQS